MNRVAATSRIANPTVPTRIGAAVAIGRRIRVAMAADDTAPTLARRRSS